MATDALDPTDRQLLSGLQHDATTAQSELGSRVGLSAAAVNRRLQRLSRAGYITRTAAVLDPARLGHPLTIVVCLEAVSEEIDKLDALQADLVAHPNVQQCYYVTGEWDYVLIVLVADMDQYRQLTRDLFFASGNVKRFKTLAVMDRAKVSLDVPLD